MGGAHGRRDLPTFSGNWNIVFKRYRAWVKADFFVRLFVGWSASLI
jgi:hypothetical protein